MTFDTQKPNESVQQALARFQSVDHLLVRPALPSIDLALNGPAAASGSKISLLDYQELEQKIRNAPADPLPYLQLAQIYYQQSRPKDTMRVLNSGVQHNPEYEPLIVFREELVLRSAEQTLDQAWQTHQRIASEETKEEWERAQTNLAHEQIAFCQARFRRHPEQHELIISWAVALRSLGRTDEAIQLLQKVAEIPNIRAPVSFELGICYELQQKPLEAFAAYRTAALYRDPPPPENLRRESLDRALQLADRLGMVDAAKRYARWLLECNIEDRASIQRKLDRLQRKML